jgi:hypothetical protein
MARVPIAPPVSGTTKIGAVFMRAGSGVAGGLQSDPRVYQCYAQERDDAPEHGDNGRHLPQPDQAIARASGGIR